MPEAADTREAGGQETAELACVSLSADCRLTKHTGHADRHTHTHAKIHTHTNTCRLLCKCKDKKRAGDHNKGEKV